MVCIIVVVPKIFFPPANMFHIRVCSVAAEKGDENGWLVIRDKRGERGYLMDVIECDKR